MKKSLAPSRKWLAACLTGAAAIATMWATTGSWDQEETIALIGFLSARGVAYLIPNKEESGDA